MYKKLLILKEWELEKEKWETEDIKLEKDLLLFTAMKMLN